MKKTIVFLLVVFSSFISCNRENSVTPEPAVANRDLDAIVASGKISVVTNLNHTGYFMYKGEPMGFYFELLRQYAEHLDLEFEIIPENDIDKACQLVQSGKADIIAMGSSGNPGCEKLISFTVPVYETRHVLVQRKPDSWRTMKRGEIEKALLRSPLELAGKSVYLQKGSSYKQSLLTLEKESGKSFEIIEVPFGSDELVKQVSHGEIPLTICDEKTAVLMNALYPNLDFSTPVSTPQKQMLGVRKAGSETLLKELNEWLGKFTVSEEYAQLEKKYFKGLRMMHMAGSEYFTIINARFSPYDDLIKKYCDMIGWDWLLVAAIIYEESHFDPSVVSSRGAYGLMQVMPSTGLHFGVDVTKSVDNNIRAGTYYLKFLDSVFVGKIPNAEERIKFILASYNAGHGHILDAMKLAVKNGFDPTKWDQNVAFFLAKKSESVYYSDPVVKNGLIKDGAAVNSYVDAVLERYNQYRNLK